jgi:P-type Cu+ transporter
MGGQHEHGDKHDSGELILSVDGMTCGNCAAKVTKAAMSVSDIIDVHVDLPSKEVHISGTSESGFEAQSFANAISAAGYAAKVKKHGTTTNLLNKWSTIVIVGSVLTVIMLIGDWGLGWQHSKQGQWLLFALGTIIIFYCGRAFLVGAINQLKQGKSDMDTLVALGSYTAYIYSCWAFFSQNSHHLYFAEAGSIISLVSLGHFLEAKVSERAQSSLKKLMSLQKDHVTLVASDGSLSTVPSAQLKIGDKILLKSGDRIPVDAKVLSGGASIDESAISGESHPIEKNPEDPLISGTVVLDGQIYAFVTAIGRNTALAKIIETVKRAQNSRASIQKLVDRVSSVFVPTVVLIAICSFALWYLNPDTMAKLSAFFEPYLWSRHTDPSRLSQAILCAVGVLIIACPCAMGLATPAALMAGSNRAAKDGVLIRDASAIEKSATITHVFFDKTGTLTEGQLSVVNLYQSETFSQLSLNLANALASHSKHPISKAIQDYCTAHSIGQRPDPVELINFKEIRGKGLSASLADGTVCRLGSLKWHKEELGINDQLLTKAESLKGSLNILSIGPVIVGVFELQDQIKKDTMNVISRLRSLDIEIGIISGDRKIVVEELARKLKVKPENAHFEVNPENKAAVIDRHQKAGFFVAFVGDGINDAPALKTATLGIAVSSATDIAKDSADLILIKNDIQQIPWALNISAKTLKTIKQNLFWAFCYNILAIPLAFMGFVSPIICAAAMGLSDLFVILNSLRLVMYSSPKQALEEVI